MGLNWSSVINANLEREIRVSAFRGSLTTTFNLSFSERDVAFVGLNKQINEIGVMAC